MHVTLSCQANCKEDPGYELNKLYCSSFMHAHYDYLFPGKNPWLLLYMEQN